MPDPSKHRPIIAVVGPSKAGKMSAQKSQLRQTAEELGKLMIASGGVALTGGNPIKNEPGFIPIKAAAQAV